MPIKFFFNEVFIKLTERRLLKQFLHKMAVNENKKIGNINYIFCSDECLLSINKEFLQHDFYTDIITFQIKDKDLSSAEIYISKDRVIENAEKFGVTEQSELHRVIFHGALHLFGYKDKTTRDQKVMKEKEDLYLNEYFLDRST